MRRANAAAAAGREVAPDALAGDALAGGGIFRGDLRPVAFEFFGDKLREARQRALPHLGARDAHDDGVVGTDHHPGIDLGRAVGGVNELRSERQIETDGEAAACGSGAEDERTAVQGGRLLHDRLPHAPAAE